MLPTVWINGAASVQIPVNDRGLAYGDGLFETIKIAAGRQTLADLHWRRLATGVKRLGITLDLEQARQESDRLLQQVPVAEAVLKIIITRGSGERGYRSTDSEPARRILALHPLPAYPAIVASRGIKVKHCRLRMGPSALAGIKHLNRLEQVMACREWQGAEYHEGLLQAMDGSMVAGTMTNLFIVTPAGQLLTPRLDQWGVAGVCRQYIMTQAASWQLPLAEDTITPEMVKQAKEVFVTNSVNGVWPVRQCDGLRAEPCCWPVGAITQVVQRKIQDVLHA